MCMWDTADVRPRQCSMYRWPSFQKQKKRRRHERDMLSSCRKISRPLQTMQAGMLKASPLDCNIHDVSLKKMSLDTYMRHGIATWCPWPDALASFLNPL